MKKITKKQWKEYGMITVATAIVAASVFFFLVPSTVSVGSISGLAIVISNFIPLPISAITLVLNVVLLIIGFIFIGKEFGGVQVYDMKDLESFCAEHTVDMAVLTLPKERAEEESERLLNLGVEGFWNFTGKELSHLPNSAVVENVHLGDSLMSLNYELCRRKSEKDKKRIKE